MTQDNFQNSVYILKDEMYRFAKKFLMSADEAEDVVMDLMMKFWQKKEELLAVDNLKSFAMRSIKNECLNRLKHHEVKLGFASQTRHNSELYQIETNNMREQILGFISRLPEKQKMVIHLKDVEEYEISEIGQMLEMEENAVRINLMRARQKVKNSINKLYEYENRQIQGLGI
ncbi:RNA polymerase sigma factor [Epilithonimonas mollis]|uniref:RNA polymerase sigma-70 factor, ECF subfamily n=1 Tax=Epilithonimonas mollis TaxID=216903 RepID=A0A1M6RJR9_9FLAO|nr:sigma-70 family RNA polymerase sigma factor [Epilithonimonas mollis]SHK32674.1 RNA polymerase sigma-70 factor, ECF subfamily [Epilithonimonas mollis]